MKIYFYGDFIDFRLCDDKKLDGIKTKFNATINQRNYYKRSMFNTHCQISDATLLEIFNLIEGENFAGNEIDYEDIDFEAVFDYLLKHSYGMRFMLRSTSERDKGFYLTYYDHQRDSKLTISESGQKTLIDFLKSIEAKYNEEKNLNV